jgi:hypothetical protein
VWQQISGPHNSPGNSKRHLVGLLVSLTEQDDYKETAQGITNGKLHFSFLCVTEYL